MSRRTKDRTCSIKNCNEIGKVLHFRKDPVTLDFHFCERHEKVRSQVWNMENMMDAANRLIGPSQNDIYSLHDILETALSRWDMEYLVSWRYGETERILRMVQGELHWLRTVLGWTPHDTQDWRLVTIRDTITSNIAMLGSVHYFLRNWIPKFRVETVKEERSEVECTTH